MRNLLALSDGVSGLLEAGAGAGPGASGAGGRRQ